MGYVDVRHGSGAYVIADADTLMTRPLRALIQLHNVSALEVLDVRRVLGMRSAPLAAKNATPDTLRGIGGALDRLAAGGDAETLTASVADFQLRIASAAGQPFLFALEAFTIRLLLHFQKIAYSDRDPAFWRDWTATPSGLRRRLFNTLKSRDSGQVSKAMEAYLKVQEKQIAGDPALSSVRMSDGAWNQAIESLATTADLVI
jgi:DNA-binding FadR family transcriptional regulator